MKTAILYLLEKHSIKNDNEHPATDVVAMSTQDSKFIQDFLEKDAKKKLSEMAVKEEDPKSSEIAVPNAYAVHSIWNTDGKPFDEGFCYFLFEYRMLVPDTANLQPDGSEISIEFKKV